MATKVFIKCGAGLSRGQAKPSRKRPAKGKQYDGQLLIALGHDAGHIPFYKQLITILEHVKPDSLAFPGGPEVQEAIMRQLRPDIKPSELIIGLEKPSSKPSISLPSTQEIADAYLTYMEDGGAAEGYLKVRARKLRFFARQYPQLPTDPQLIRAYLRQFKTADVPTRQDQWKALTALYKYAYQDNPNDNPMLKVDKPRFRKKSGQRLSRDQAKLLLSAIKTDPEWALVTCYFGLRFRRVEAERLRFG
ncbi:unnamed protein product, partial [marine sediment metagenome]